MHGFRSNGIDWLTGIWIKPQLGPVAHAHNRALLPFFLEDASHRSNGRFNQAMTGYDDGFGNALFAGVWRGFPLGQITAAPVATAALATSIRFVADAMASTECRLNNDGFQPCTSPVQVDLRTEGHYRFDLRVLDRDGTPGATKTARWTVNRDVISADSFEYGEQEE